MSMETESPSQILSRLYASVNEMQDIQQIFDITASKKLEYLARCQTNRAGVRFLMSCMLAKVHHPHVDPREPYTEIGGQNCFSGRTYDEHHITGFITRNNLPCNNTTAYLTPAFRNHSGPLVLGTNFNGRPQVMYENLLDVLDDVAYGRFDAESVLAEAIRFLCIVRDERQRRLETLLETLQDGEDHLPLSSESVVTLIAQHLACHNASRLPVLVVAAAYEAAKDKLSEEAGSLNAHNAADEKTGALGDVEVYLVGQDNVVTSYEMKTRRVTIGDIDRAIEKIEAHEPRVDNYVFITTEPIETNVAEYCRQMYESLGGVEVVVLNCIDFLRHFLHLFHRSRMDFLDAYQALVLAEPESAVPEPSKAAFLSLRRAAESE